MPYYDNHVLMTLKLDRWSPDYQPAGWAPRVSPGWLTRLRARFRRPKARVLPAIPNDTRPKSLIS